VEAAARFVGETGAAGVTETALGTRLGVGPAELEDVLSKLARNGGAVLVGRSPRVLISRDVVDGVGEKLEAMLRKFQKQNPLLGGMPKSELREKAGAGASSDVFEHILAKLAEKNRLRVERDLVATFDHRILLSEDETRARDFLVERYRLAGVRPQSLEEVASEGKKDRKLLERVQRVLLKEGTLVQISAGMVFHKEALAELKANVRSCKSQRDRIDVAFFKEFAGVTRKHAIPLLEWLDRERVTHRAGNERVIL
ncbi:MAG: SelB C-terminal domain-containing protein, partial [Vicinamibacteria bacterium]